MTYPRRAASRSLYVSLGAFIIVLTLGAAALALWTVVRFPNLGPETLFGALLQVGIALAAGAFLVPAGMNSALAFEPPTGPMLAIFAVVLPGLSYLFLTTLWAMRVLQQMLMNARR
jgi:hypothetical protein